MLKINGGSYRVKHFNTWGRTGQKKIWWSHLALNITFLKLKLLSNSVIFSQYNTNGLPNIFILSSEYTTLFFLCKFIDLIFVTLSV